MEKIRKKYMRLYTILIGFYITICNNKVFAGLNCEEELAKIKNGEETTLSFIKDIYGMIIIIVPILIVVFSTIDFIKALTAQKDDDMKKSYSNLVKRLIIGVSIIFAPVLINLIIKLSGTETCLW